MATTSKITRSTKRLEGNVKAGKPDMTPGYATGKSVAGAYA
jgi:hypothetical protein